MYQIDVTTRRIVCGNSPLLYADATPAGAMGHVRLRRFGAFALNPYQACAATGLLIQIIRRKHHCRFYGWPSPQKGFRIDIQGNRNRVFRAPNTMHRA
jgi:hypothetical protein